MDNHVVRVHHGDVTDRLHDHITFGFRRGYVACAQTEADMVRSRRAFHGRQITAVGDALWERVMDGDATAIPEYQKWLTLNAKFHGLVPSNREGVAALQVTSP